MSWTTTAAPNHASSIWRTIGLSLLGVGAFQMAYFFSAWSFLILVYLYSVADLAHQPTNRRAFYAGLAMGFLAYAPQLTCFYAIFGAPAVALWLVLAFWIGLFALLARLSLVYLGPARAVWLLPFIWTGLEYFRSELYYLRFTWLNAGYAFADQVPAVPLAWFGVYGVGFVLMLGIALLNLISLGGIAGGRPANPLVGISSRHRILRRLLENRSLHVGVGALVAVGLWLNVPRARRPPTPGDGVAVAGVQMEFPGYPQVITALNKLKQEHPEAPLLVLSEYTFTEALPDGVRKWCLQNQRYLVVGAKDFVSETKFFDSAFVIDPRGEIVFRQAKSVPIQFFNDGLPARQQRVWESPWGKIGICICYDLSYTRVIDELVRLGAQALIVPTMDVAEWGRHQHELHARIATTRAAEYGLPIFRVASSGISQLVDARGTVKATAPFPGEEAMISGRLEMAAQGHIPWDRLVAQISVAVTAALILWMAAAAMRCKLNRRPSEAPGGFPVTR